MITFQDFEKMREQNGIEKAIETVIDMHTASTVYQTALDADAYDHQQNTTIMNYVKKLYNSSGAEFADPTASNNKLCSNFFRKLNTQRCNYSLGNGVSFSQHKTKKIDPDTHIETTVDETKARLGAKFDTALKKVAYFGLIHGESFGLWDLNQLTPLKITNFAPLVDEETSELKAGVRFWQIDSEHPLMAILYEIDGWSRYRKDTGEGFRQIQALTPYIKRTTGSKEGGISSVDFKSYDGKLPIIPFYGSELQQSTLVGMKGKIDAFDLIGSGFANDLEDCAMVYWILENAGGMDEVDMADFMKRLKFQHVAKVDTNESKATPYTQEIPTEARETFKTQIRSEIYEDFGALDVHTIAAGATNDHIDAAYQPLDDNADDFEFQVSEFLEGLLGLIGIEDSPIFKRNRISNQGEQTTMVLSASDYLDDETILNHLPFINIDEIPNILIKKDQEMADKFEDTTEDEEEDEEKDDQTKAGAGAGKEDAANS